MEIGVNFLIASGFAGQTQEVLQFAGEPEPFERIVGYRLKSYAMLSWLRVIATGVGAELTIPEF